MAALRPPRTTLHLDILVGAAAQVELVGLLERLGYETLNRSAGYSNHLHHDAAWGRVDVVYVSGDTATKLFEQANEQIGPGGQRIRVPRPEHLAAMKALAIKNDPARTFQDLADVRFLLTRPGVDRDLVRDYFARYGLVERYEDVARTL